MPKKTQRLNGFWTKSRFPLNNPITTIKIVIEVVCVISIVCFCPPPNKSRFRRRWSRNGIDFAFCEVLLCCVCFFLEFYKTKIQWNLRGIYQLLDSQEQKSSAATLAKLGSKSEDDNVRWEDVEKDKSTAKTPKVCHTKFKWRIDYLSEVGWWGMSGAAVCKEGVEVVIVRPSA